MNRDSRRSNARPEFGALSASSAREGFSLIDVLVTIAIISILIGILLPSLSSVNETARRVACRSTIRQLGLGLISFADSHSGILPGSVYLPPGLRDPTYGPRTATWAAEPQNMLTLNVPPERKLAPLNWDGLGILFSEGLLPSPKIFYCPSHRGEHPFSRYSLAFEPETSTEIVGNYHYRGYGPVYSPQISQQAGINAPLTRDLDKIYPRSTALVADGMQTRLDYNHRVGVNVFRADLSAEWFADPAGRLARSLPATRADVTGARAVEDAWRSFDAGPTAD